MLVYHEEKRNKQNAVGVLLLSPIIGLAYSVSLPFIGITATLVLTVKKALDGIVGMIGFGWRPSEAYLSGKKKNKRK